VSFRPLEGNLELECQFMKKFLIQYATALINEWQNWDGDSPKSYPWIGACGD
jgi:hypothetical protein